MSLNAYKRAASVVLHSHRSLNTPTISLLSHPAFNFTTLTSHNHRHLTTMTSNIVLPPLPKFVQQRITALYSAKTPADFDDAFDAFVAEDARITLNGKHVSRNTYKKMIKGEISNDAGAEVTFQGVVSVDADADKDLNAIGVSFLVGYDADR